MGLAYNTYLNSNRIYGCKNCKAHLANHEDIISRVRNPFPSLKQKLTRLTSGTELPRPARQGIPLQHGRQRRDGRA